ncbi:MAG: YbaB/EbfC family nucleoid-associated protein [Patescibacteria group bacterium]
MFSKLKQIKDLRSKAKQMQNLLSGESATAERGGIKITMDGNMNVTALTIAEGTAREKIEQEMPRVINDVIKEIQKIMARKMQEAGGIPGFN